MLTIWTFASVVMPFGSHSIFHDAYHQYCVCNLHDTAPMEDRVMELCNGGHYTPHYTLL